MERQTGILLTTPRGNHFWIPAATAEEGLRKVEQQGAAGVYGDSIGHRDTVIAFGNSDGKVFAETQRLWPKGDE